MFFTIHYITNEEKFLSNSARLYVFFFFTSVSCSLLINTPLVFIWYFVSVPLRKAIGVQSISVCLIVCTCSFLHFWLFVLRLLVFRRLFCNNINKLAGCTDSNEALKLFEDLFWRMYQTGSFSPEALELYWLVFSLTKIINPK